MTPSPEAHPRTAAASEQRLLVADQVAGVVHVLDLPDGRVRGRLRGRHLAEHAGFLALPGDRTAFVDDRAGELVVLAPFADADADADSDTDADAPGGLVEARAAVAVPGEHLAADPSGRRLAVTSGLGRNWEPWSDLLTVVDLGAEGGPDAVRVRARVGEPGVTVVGADDPLVVLRHREPGALAAYRHSALLTSPPACPPARPDAELPLPDDGHGDAHDPVHGRVFAATGEGVHRARVVDGGLTAEDPLPWGVEGRGYYLRLDPVRRTLWSCVRGGPPAPEAWPEWTNHAWWHPLDGSHRGAEHGGGSVELGPGLVFRLAVAAHRVAFARVHPDGDELVLLDAERPRVVARVPLPPMAGAPRRGGTPWDGVQRRAIAASPGGPLIAVSRGGHGEVLLVDSEQPDVRRELTVPTPLDEGGHMALMVRGDGAHGDPVGR
ncbi:hypothetical protein [Streptomyces sp. Da 82-17]|uniref:hypothetical protein n=1 Tax=Streptomyces sp. Da 82-17 TaxID=3377116 RepID=UPI0038D4F580